MTYLDASAFAKAFLDEAGSVGFRAYLSGGGRTFCTSGITWAEVFSLLNRALREQRISRDAYSEYRQDFLTFWRNFQVFQPQERLLGRAEALIERHGLRALDTVHLCTALHAGCRTLACYDNRLRAAAEAEGIALFPATLAG